MKTLGELIAACDAQNKQLISVIAELECTTRMFALERAELRHAVMRVFDEWDGRTLTEEYDELINRMESLRAALDA